LVEKEKIDKSFTLSKEYTKNIKSKKFRSSILPLLILAPSIVLVIWIFVPFIMAIILSFTNYSFNFPIWGYVGGENWIKVLSNYDFWHGVLVTFEFGASATAVEMFAGLGIALLLNRSSPFTKILRVVLLFPLMIAPVIASLIWELLLNSSVGIVQKFLNIFGLYNVPWASSPKMALLTVVMIDAWIYIPFATLLLLAGLQSLPKSPYEAAKLDGASSWFSFKNLTLPMLKPIIYVTLIFELMFSLREFTIPFATTGGGPGDTLMNLSLLGYEHGFTFYNLGLSLPYVLVLWIIIYVISYYLVSKWQKSKVSR